MKAKMTTQEKIEKATNRINEINVLLDGRKEKKLSDNEWLDLYSEFQKKKVYLETLKRQLKREQMDPSEIEFQKKMRETHDYEKQLTNEVLKIVPYEPKKIVKQSHSFRVDLGMFNQEELNELREILDKNGYCFVIIRETEFYGITVLNIPFTSIIRKS